MIFFSENPFRALCSQQMVAPHHERIDIVMLPRNAPEMQIDRPSAGENRTARADSLAPPQLQVTL